jgi:hypothetical protein
MDNESKTEESFFVLLHKDKDSRVLLQVRCNRAIRTEKRRLTYYKGTKSSIQPYAYGNTLYIIPQCSEV